MRNKLFLLTFIILLTTFSMDAQSARGVRIGYIDMEYILESVPEYQEATIQLDGKVQQWRKDIESRQKEIDQLKLNLSNERVLLTNELVKEREEDIKVKEDALFQYQQDRFGPGGDLMIQKRQLVQPIQDQVFNAVQEIAGNRQYDFIFDKSADVVMLYAAERNDISDQVIRIINRTAKRTQAESKQDKKAIETRDNMSDEQDKALTEREKAVEDKKNEREALLEERRKTRDSIKDARQLEFEERRNRILQERSNATGGGNNQGTGNTEEGTETIDLEDAGEGKSAVEETREDIIENRKRVQDSIQNARKLEQEERRNKILEERQRKQDSIIKARQNKNNVPINSTEEEETED